MPREVREDEERRDCVEEVGFDLGLKDKVGFNWPVGKEGQFWAGG